MHFSQGETTYHDLFRIVGTSRAMIESMTGDHRVFVAFSPAERNWYLRFFADWDETDTNLIGEYSITLSGQLSNAFLTDLLPKLNCPISTDQAISYFQRIEAS